MSLNFMIVDTLLTPEEERANGICQAAGALKAQAEESFAKVQQIKIQIGDLIRAVADSMVLTAACIRLRGCTLIKKEFLDRFLEECSGCTQVINESIEKLIRTTPTPEIMIEIYLGSLLGMLDIIERDAQTGIDLDQLTGYYERIAQGMTNAARLLHAYPKLYPSYLAYDPSLVNTVLGTCPPSVREYIVNNSKVQDNG